MTWHIVKNDQDGLGKIREYLEYVNIQFSDELNIYDIKEYSQKLHQCAETYFLINKNNEYIGMCSIYVNDYENKVLYISTISLKKEYLSKGFGQILLNHILKLKDDYKMNFIKLEVKKNNQKAFNFYKKNGFHIFEEKSCSYIMIK